MTKETIKTIQNYLTVESRKILDIETLIAKHPISKVVSLLENLIMEKKDIMKDLMAIDVTNQEIDRNVAEFFRIGMALKIIREEVRCEKPKTEQGAESSC